MMSMNEGASRPRVGASMSMGARGAPWTRELVFPA